MRARITGSAARSFGRPRTASLSCGSSARILTCQGRIVGYKMTATPSLLHAQLVAHSMAFAGEATRLASQAGVMLAITMLGSQTRLMMSMVTRLIFPHPCSLPLPRQRCLFLCCLRSGRGRLLSRNAAETPARPRQLCARLEDRHALSKGGEEVQSPNLC